MGQLTRRLPGLVALVALLGLGASAAPANNGLGTTHLWAGHQVLVGEKAVPIIGKVETRTDTYFIATFEKRGAEWVLKQRVCKTTIKPTLGVTVRFPKGTVQKLPSTDVTFDQAPDGYWYATPWTSGWGKEDLDADGHPGITLDIGAPLCSGQVYVASQSTSQARAKRTDDLWVGQIRVQVAQKTLGASNKCLTLLSNDDDDKAHGTFAYTKVPDGSTCESLEKKHAWPTRAAEPTASAR